MQKIDCHSARGALRNDSEGINCHGSQGSPRNDEYADAFRETRPTIKSAISKFKMILRRQGGGDEAYFYIRSGEPTTTPTKIALKPEAHSR